MVNYYYKQKMIGLDRISMNDVDNAVDDDDGNSAWWEPLAAMNEIA
jgi:hypothetical protein